MTVCYSHLLSLCIRKQHQKHTSIFHVMALYQVVAAAYETGRIQKRDTAQRIAPVKSLPQIILRLIRCMHYQVI